MSPDPKVSIVAYVIQLSVAPVFLLSGVSVTLSVLTNRLARIVDRARKLAGATATSTDESLHRDLALLNTRARCIHRAITQSVACALLICVVIILLFASAFISADLAKIIAGVFVCSILSFVGALVSFLREVFLATKSLHIGASTRPLDSENPIG